MAKMMSAKPASAADRWRDIGIVFQRQTLAFEVRQILVYQAGGGAQFLQQFGRRPAPRRIGAQQQE